MKIKKITALLLGLCGAFAFAACDDEPATTNDDTPTPTHTHTFATEWSKDETHHWYACTGSGCKDVSEKAEHVFDGGEITTPATATQEGVKTFTCETCGATKTEPVEYVPDTEVTAEEWATAVAMNAENYTGVFTVTIDEKRVRVIIQKEADTFLRTAGEFLGEELTDVEESYYEKDGDTYYHYWSENEQWYKGEMPEEEYESAKSDLFVKNMNFADFTYNAEIKKYEWTSDTLDTSQLQNVTIAFVEGQVAEVAYTRVMLGRRMHYLYTYTYGDAEITLPQVVSSTKIKDDNMLASAFTAAFAMQDNCEYAVGVSCLDDMTYIDMGGYYTYTAVYDEEYNAQADYQAHFLDGKLVKLEVFIDGVKTYVFTYDYEVEEIQIPEV